MVGVLMKPSHSDLEMSVIMLSDLFSLKKIFRNGPYIFKLEDSKSILINVTIYVMIDKKHSINIYVDLYHTQTMLYL
jgi:hypothetical protein